MTASGEGVLWSELVVSPKGTTGGPLTRWEPWRRPAGPPLGFGNMVGTKFMVLCTSPSLHLALLTFFPD